jgi:hypothetical protein
MAQYRLEYHDAAVIELDDIHAFIALMRGTLLRTERFRRSKQRFIG